MDNLKLELLEITHAGKGATCRLHTERPGLDSIPWPSCSALLMEENNSDFIVLWFKEVLYNQSYYLFHDQFSALRVSPLGVFFHVLHNDCQRSMKDDEGQTPCCYSYLFDDIFSQFSNRWTSLFEWHLHSECMLKGPLNGTRGVFFNHVSSFHAGK